MNEYSVLALLALLARAVHAELASQVVSESHRSTRNSAAHPRAVLQFKLAISCWCLSLRIYKDHDRS